MKPAVHLFGDIRIGDEYSFKRTITGEDTFAFARLTGDYNPLHTDPTYGAASPYGKNIVHGMLAGSLFSTLVGMYCPGEKSLYISQTLNFKKPIFPGDTITIKGTVVSKNDSIQLITLKTEIIKDGDVMVSGEAKVKML